MDFSKLKSQLLKSSLPLELEAANGLAAEGFFIVGDFNYERQDESGELKLFSVDVHGSWTSDTNKELNALIECKYSHEGNIWIFTNYPETQEVFMSDFGATDPNKQFKIDKDALEDFVREHPLLLLELWLLKKKQTQIQSERGYSSFATLFPM